MGLTVAGTSRALMATAREEGRGSEGLAAVVLLGFPIAPGSKRDMYV
jgi:hypothetical protein